MKFTCSIVKLWNSVSQSTVDVAVFKKTPSKLAEKNLLSAPCGLESHSGKSKED